MTREEWLNAATDRIRSHAATVGVSIPGNVRVSIGFPSTRAVGSKSGRVIGQCFHPPASADGFFEVFISPVHETSEAILSTLVHELVHAAVSPSKGHRVPFQKAGARLGLVGPWPSAGFPSGVLPGFAAGILASLGPIPHAALNPGFLAKKQGTRMRKLECSDCGYIVRTTASWISLGLPTCYCGGRFAEEGTRQPTTLGIPVRPVRPRPAPDLVPTEPPTLDQILESGKLTPTLDKFGRPIVVEEEWLLPQQALKARLSQFWKGMDSRTGKFTYIRGYRFPRLPHAYRLPA